MPRGKEDGRRQNKKKTKKVELETEDEVKCGVCEKYLWEKEEEDDDNEDQGKNLECEICMRWFHAVCIEDGVATYNIVTKQKAIHWYCQQCDHAATELHKKLTILQTENDKLRKDLTALSTKVKRNDSAIKTAEKNCKTYIDNKFRQEKAEMKAEIRKETLAEVLGSIEQHLDEAEVDDDNNPWSKVTRARANQPQPPQDIPNLRNIISQELSEKKRIELLKYNLIIAGIEEQEETEDAEELKQKAIDIIVQHLDIQPGIQSVERCGKRREKTAGEPDPKPRPLRIVVDNLETRKDILMNATKLRVSEDAHIKANVFINPDLTRAQQLEAKNT